MTEIKNLGNVFFESYEAAYASYKMREELIRSNTIKAHVFQIQTHEIFNGERNKKGAIWNVITTKEVEEI